MNELVLVVLIIGAVVAAATAWCIAAYIVITTIELIEKIMERYFPHKYYYDWDESVEEYKEA